MSLKERLEILDLINQVQNESNSFVNIDVDDLEMIYKHVIKHDLDTQETIQLLKDLSFV